MAILPNTEIYITILIIGGAYLLISAILDLEILLGHFSLGLPYALIGWGVIGLVTNNEPNSFIWGFLFIWISISAMYLYLSSYTSSYEKYYLKSAVVTIPIKPGKIGEIKVSRGEGFDFLPAKASNIIKPIGKNETVRIIELEGVNAHVSVDYKEIRLENTFSKFYNRIATFLRLLTIKSKHSGVCIVCYGNIKGSKNFTKCPSCDSIAHKDHMIDWLDIRKTCPHCRSEIEFKGTKLTMST
ncbi:MAG: hypothetical protein ACW99A_11160 [Candidatus Kariarchaeaceae archaeon]|jgi:hypothetical protein